MPALPWVQVSEPDRKATYVVMASRLPLRRYVDLPSFVRASGRVRHQLATADGLIGYSLDAKPLAKTFSTLSAWRDQESLDRFARAQPHRDLIAAIRPRMKPTTFVTWTATGSEIPLRWDTARQRISREAGDR